MKHEIKNRFTGKVLFTCEVPDGLESGMITRHAVEEAISSNADLSGADLSRANLSCADLRGANLSCAKNTPLIINGLHWIVSINGFGMMQIGCQRHKVEEWASFNDDQISEMDSHALAFWNKNKEMLLSICDSYKHERE
mgnify:CR=1 FL=1